MPYQKIVPILKAAGIHVHREAEELLHVTRQTIYKWDQGVDPKMPHVRKVVDYTLARVAAAVKAKLLPLDAGVKDPKERLEKIRLAIRKADETMNGGGR